MSSNLVVEVRRDELAACMTCPLCNKLFKDATTIPECLHTFCRKCIRKKITDEELECCPICKIDLGCVPLEKLRADHNLQDVRAKIFPYKRRRVKAPEVVASVTLPLRRKERSLSSLVVSTPRVSTQTPLTGKQSKFNSRKKSCGSSFSVEKRAKKKDDSMDDCQESSSSPETLNRVKHNSKQVKIQTTSTTPPLTPTTFALAHSITLPLQTTSLPTYSTTPPATTSDPVVTATPLSSGKSRRPPVYTDPILDRICALEKANANRAKRELTLINFIKEQQAVNERLLSSNERLTRERDVLAHQVGELKECQEFDRSRINTQRDWIQILQRRVDSQQQALNESSLRAAEQHKDICRLDSQVSYLEGNLSSSSNVAQTFRRVMDSTIDQSRMAFERLESRVDMLENESQLARQVERDIDRLRNESVRLQGLIRNIEDKLSNQTNINTQHAVVHEYLVNRYLAVLELIRMSDEDVTDLRIRLSNIFRDFSQNDQETTILINKRKKVLTKLLDDAEGVVTRGKPYGYFTSFTNFFSEVGPSGVADDDDSDISDDDDDVGGDNPK